MKELNFSSTGKELRPHWQQPPLQMFDDYRVWKEIVEMYSRACLTMPKDKLVAISALAKEARLALKDDYLAGLWRRHLGWELGWQASEDFNHTRPSDYRCPSWSWAPIDGEIYATAYGSNAHLLLKVLQAQITPLGDDDIGEIADGFVRVQGRLYAVVFNPNGIKCVPYDNHGVFLSEKTVGGEVLRKMSASVHLDIDITTSTNAREKFYCLLQYSSDIDIWCQPDANYYLMALLLKYHGTTMNYSRLGLLQLHSFDDSPPIQSQ